MLRIFKKGPPQSHQRAEDDIVELDVWRFHHQDAVGLLTCGWLVCRLTSHQEFDEKKNELRKMFSPGDSQKLQPRAGQPPEAQGTPSPVPRLAAPVPGFMDGDCSHEIRRHLLLGRKAMTNLDSILKSRDITANKGPCSQSYGFSSSHVQMWELVHKESWVPKNWCFQECAGKGNPLTVLVGMQTSTATMENSVANP